MNGIIKMKIKDLHSNLNKDINLLKFYQKKEISVDSFWIEKNIIKDLHNKNLEKNIKLKQKNKILIKKINKKNNFDWLKKIKRKKILSPFEKNNKKIDIQKFIKWKLDYFLSLFKTERKKNIYLIEFFKNFKKQKLLYKILFFIIISCITILLDKKTIEYYTNNWYKKIEQLKNNWNLKQKIKLAKSSYRDFQIANFLFIPFSIFPGEKINNAKYVISWWLKVSDLIVNITNFIKKSDNFVEKKWEENIMYSQLLENSKNIFIYTEKKLNEIIKIYSKINFSKDKIKQNKIDYFLYQTKKYNYYIEEINNNFNTFLNILGHNKRKKYLIVFQNNDEIRAQWGFMWSMGILEIFRWQIKKFEKRDVYDYEFKIKKEHFKKEKAPEWLNKLTPNLWLRDSNYFINLKDSSEKIRFFINKAWFDIDGIIYINQNTLLEILDLIWEYHSKVLNTDVNSKNFSLLMSSLVEAKKSKVGTLWTPKKVLFDFIEEFKNKIKSEKISKFKILKILLKDIEKREIKFYLFDKKERELLKNISLYNPINYNKTLDFNYPVFTSISWNKSDRYIAISYKKIVKKTKNCDFDTSFEINLKHNFNKKEENKILNIFNKFWIKDTSSKLLNIQWKWENRQYIRVILPKNIILKNKKDFISIKNYNKNEKSVAFFLNTKPWEKSSFKINYILKNTNCELYNYELYKQPGIKKYNLKLNTFGKNSFFSNIKEDLFINK